jgi:hypothetical protein
MGSSILCFFTLSGIYSRLGEEFIIAIENTWGQGGCEEPEIKVSVRLFRKE